MICPNCNHRKESTTAKCRRCGFEPVQSDPHSFDLPPDNNWRVARVCGALVSFSGPDDGGRVHVLGPYQNGIGRARDSRVLLDDPTVDGHHGTVVVSPEDEGDAGPTARFMDTSNAGSLVDGAPVHGREVALTNGARIRIGRFVLVYCLISRPRADAWR